MQGTPAASTTRGFSTAAVKRYARKELIEILDSVRGKKDLVLDPTLSGPLSIIAEFSLLKEHGVERIYLLSSEQLKTDCKSLIYICRPTLQNVNAVAAQIKANSNAGRSLDYSLFFVPRRTLVCERVLEEAGVYGEITLGEYHLDLIPLEDDVLSLEFDNAFCELFLDRDTSCLFAMAQAIMKLQSMFGIAPRIVGKGANAKLLSDLLMRLRQELLANAPDSGAAERVFPIYSDIDSLIIIDRSVDLVTPMCTQLTYEGLIDEFFGIRSTFVEVDPSFIAGPSPTGIASGSTAAVHNKPKKIALNNSDKLHAQLRDLNFAVVGSSLSQAARRIHDNYEGRHQAKTVSQLKNFIGKLSDLQAEHQSLRLHTGIAEELTKATNDKDFNSALEAQQNFVAGIVNKSHLEYIEHLIDKQGPMTQAVRLLCLHSLVEGGMKAKAYDSFRRDIVQAYGHKHVLTLQNLAEVGLFRKQTSRASSYPSIRKAFRLIVDDVNEHDPNDASYVYSGYAPISVRLVQVACHRDVSMPISASGGPGNLQQVTWKGWEEHLKLLPGPTFEDQQTAADRRKGTRNSDRPKTTLVVFLGGCTFTEVAALRFLTQREEGRREFIVVTTNMINGSTLLDSLADRVRQSAPPNSQVH